MNHLDVPMGPANPLSWRIPIMLGKTLTSSPPPEMLRF